MVINNERPRSKTINTILDQQWRSKPHKDETLTIEEAINDNTDDLYQYSRKL